LSCRWLLLKGDVANRGEGAKIKQKRNEKKREKVNVRTTTSLKMIQHYNSVRGHTKKNDWNKGTENPITPNSALEYLVASTYVNIHKKFAEQEIDEYQFVILIVVAAIFATEFGVCLDSIYLDEA